LRTYQYRIGAGADIGWGDQFEGARFVEGNGLEGYFLLLCTDREDAGLCCVICVAFDFQAVAAYGHNVVPGDDFVYLSDESLNF
jgi:hypothetical protein